MAVGSSILSALASGRNDAANFLASHSNLARKLEKTPDEAQRFDSASDDPNRRSISFRGINHINPSPFGARQMKDFRGISKNKFDGLTNPDVYVNDSPIDNRYQINPQRQVFIEDDIREAERTDFGDVEGYAYLRQHPQAAQQLADNENLREDYSPRDELSEYELQERINWAARQRLDANHSVSDEYLRANPDEARLIALNAGNISGELNDDSELAEGLVGEPRDEYSADIRREFADRVAAKLDPETGIDREFLEANPEAAVYLNNRPGLIELFNRRPEDGENFKRFYGEIRSQVQDEAVERASEAVSGAGDFTRDYLERNPQLANDIAVDRELNPSSSIADSTNRFGALKDKTTFANDVYRDHLATQASDKLGNVPFDREFMQEHSGLAYSIDKSDSLAAGMVNDADLVEAYLPADGGVSPAHNRAMTALSAGYPYRQANIVDIWS